MTYTEANTRSDNMNKKRDDFDAIQLMSSANPYNALLESPEGMLLTSMLVAAQTSKFRKKNNPKPTHYVMIDADRVKQIISSLFSYMSSLFKNKLVPVYCLSFDKQILEYIRASSDVPKCVATTESIYATYMRRHGYMVVNKDGSFDIAYNPIDVNDDNKVKIYLYNYVPIDEESNDKEISC